MMRNIPRGWRRRSLYAAAFVVLIGHGSTGLRAQRQGDKSQAPLVIAKQGSFLVGGTVTTNAGTFDPNNPTPAGQTVHGDHAYVQYQIPVDARPLPMVMWHGGGQFSKTWETTPDGRDGYQNIFLRRGWSVYLVDQPRRGRAGRSTVGTTIDPVAGEQALFAAFRLGVWPNLFPGVQFSRDPEALNQYFRQQTPNTGPADNEVVSAAIAALFDKIGPAVLLTHSASGGPGWLTRIKSANVKAIVSYEPAQFMFPEGEVPAPIVTPKGTNTPVSVSAADFKKLTEIPIQIIYGDNIPTETSAIPGLDAWYRSSRMAKLFVDAVNAHGGHAQLVMLPDVGLKGNTHFAFSDLNNVQVADLLSSYLSKNGLDRRGGRTD
jgi:hypothetical protein